MAKIVLLTRAQFWRVALAGWFGGFFLCRIVERFVNPQVREEVATVLVIGAFVLVFIGAFILVFTSARIGRPRFINYNKDQLALIERRSAFLDRHHLWNQFLTEDPQAEALTKPPAQPPDSQ